jgi:hypothetical protein
VIDPEERKERKRQRRKQAKAEPPERVEPVQWKPSPEPEELPAPWPRRVSMQGEFYLKDAVADSETALLDTSERIVLTIAYGQSNGEAGGLVLIPRSERVVTLGVVDPHRAMMLDTGLLGVNGEPLDGATLSDFVAACEHARGGESGGSSYLRYTLGIADAAALPQCVHVYRSAGQGGQPLAALHEGTQAFFNFLTTVERSRYLARRYGRSLWLPHFLMDQGEADRKRDVDASAYRGELVRLRERLEHFVRRITRQQEPVWMLLTILAAPAEPATGTDSAISLAQVAALSEPCIAPVCSPYWFHGDYGFIAGQQVHWRALAKAFLREFGSRAARIVREAMQQNPQARLGDLIYRQVFDPALDGGNGGWTLRHVPFETAPRTDEASIRRDGDTISGEVFYAEHGLSLHSAGRGMATDYGFSWTGSGRIVGVHIDNDGARSRWKIELSAGSAGTLSYATALQQAGPGNEAGVDDGPQKWGNVFDNCAEPSLAIPQLTLRQGMLPFSVAVQ